MDEKKCVICAKPIPVDAVKCSVCGSHQKWLNRKLSFSSLILSLLISLFAVLGYLWPQIAELIYPQKTNIVIRQSEIDKSFANMEVKQGIYELTGKALSDNLKLAFKPRDTGNQYHTYTDDRQEIYFRDDNVQIKNLNEDIDVTIIDDSIYYIVEIDIKFEIEFKFILRNTGEKYGLVHYLKSEEDMIKKIQDIIYTIEFPTPLVMVSTYLEGKQYHEEHLNNYKVIPEFIEGHKLDIKDVIKKIFIYNRCDDSFIMDTESFIMIGETFVMGYTETPNKGIIDSVKLQSLIYNHDNTESKNFHFFKIHLTGENKVASFISSCD